MVTKYLFVGERRSKTAQRMSVTWAHGRLAAKPLFESLRACGLDPKEQRFLNLFYGEKCEKVNFHALRKIRLCKLPVVALGRRVQKELQRRGVEFIPLVHPAARGLIRKRSRYIKHVKFAFGLRDNLAAEVGFKCSSSSEAIDA